MLRPASPLNPPPGARFLHTTERRARRNPITEVQREKTTEALGVLMFVNNLLFILLDLLRSQLPCLLYLLGGNSQRGWEGGRRGEEEE